MSAPTIVRRFPLMRRLSRIFVVILTITFFVGMTIVPFEMHAPNAKIRNGADGLWWAISTVTTVGYGDIVPVTDFGRLFGALLQISGAVLFGTLVGTITVYLDQAQEDYEWRRIHEQLDRTEDELISLKHKLDFLIKNKDNKQNTPPRWRI